MWNVVINLGKPFTIEVNGKEIDVSDSKITIGFGIHQSALEVAKFIEDHVTVEARAKEYGKQPTVVAGRVIR